MATAAPPRPRARPRPMSPHLTHWKWRIHMIVSVLHRVTGQGLALGAIPILLWWLLSAASGPEAYAAWYEIASGPFGYLAGVGVTWLFFQHAANGIRHLVMDTGSGFDLATNRATASATIVVSLAATLVVWAFIILL